MFRKIPTWTVQSSRESPSPRTAGTMWPPPRGESRTYWGLDPPAGGEFNIQPVALRLTIGDFSRMTHLSVKALRHYHQIGLLEPVAIDTDSGYRLYDVEQVPVAQVIKRLKDLGMALDEIARVLQAPHVEARNRAIVEHLQRMEDQLEQTRATVASLRRLLETPEQAQPRIEFRATPATSSIAIRDRVAVH